MASKPEPQTLEEFRAAIREARTKVLQSTRELGELLVSASKHLTNMEWGKLYDELRQDMTKGEIDATIAVGDGTLDERLFPAGIVHSKIMNMSRPDQQRLLSGERFQVYSDISPFADDAIKRTWLEMSKEQRSRLISDKGGRILPLSEQRPPKSGRTQRVQFYLFSSHRDDMLILKSGNREGRIDLSAMRHSMTLDDRKAFTRALLSEDVMNDDGDEE